MTNGLVLMLLHALLIFSMVILHSPIVQAETPNEIMQQVLNHTGDKVIHAASIDFEIKEIRESNPSKPTAQNDPQSSILKGYYHYRKSDAVELHHQDMVISHEKNDQDKLHLIYLERQSESNQRELVIKPTPVDQSILIFSDSSRKTNNGHDHACQSRMVGRFNGFIQRQLQNEPSSEFDMTFPHDLHRSLPGAVHIELTKDIHAPAEGLIYLDCFVECHGKKIHLGRIGTDPDRDFICPLIEEYDPHGGLVGRWESQGYFQDPESLVWFPRACTHTTTDRGNTSIIEYQFDPHTTTLNQEIPPETFSIKLEAGTTLHKCFLLWKVSRWKVKDNFLLSSANLISWESNPHLELVTPQSSPLLEP